MPAPRRAALLSLCLLAGCSDAEQATAPTGGGLCADATRVLQFPTPWWGDGALVPPPGDALAAIAAIDRGSWLEQLAEVDGLPRRPAFFVALSGRASGVDAAAVRLVDQDGAPLAVELEIALDELGTTLVVKPRFALPEAVEAGALGIERGAVVGAEPRSACAPAGVTAAGEYDAAAALAGTAFGVPFRLATRHRAQRAIAEAYAAAPALTVASIAAVPFDGFGSRSPSAAVVAALRAPAVAGAFETPLWIDDRFHPVVEPAGTTRPTFAVALPATGSAPYPWVLVQHGGGNDKRLIFEIGQPWLERGFALVGVDLLFHGDRADAGSRGSGAEFLTADDPLRVVGMFRQTSADHLAVLTGLDAFNAALAPLTGDAVTLDPARAWYMGHSLGALSGSLTVAVAPNLRGGALVTGGAHWEDMMQGGAFALVGLGLLRNRPLLERQAVLHLGQALLDAVEPGVQAARWEVAADRTVLVLEAIEDSFFVNATTDHLALGWGATLVTPAHHAVPGMPEAAPPFAGSGPTRALVQFPFPELAATARHGAVMTDPRPQALIARCFEAQRDGGTCTVFDTGWGD